MGDGEARLVTSSYVLVEMHALVQRRLGMEALRDLHHRVVPLLDVVWVGEDIHTRAVAMLLRENCRQLSLVDCVSFVLMDELEITHALAFDSHYAERGLHAA